MNQQEIEQEKKSLYHPVKIGSLELDGNLFLAPVAGYSDRAFRSVCFDFGANFAYTEMVSAEALVRGNKKTEFLMRRAPNEKFYAVQIFGGNAHTMEEAAKIVIEQTSADCIDINCGCPVPKIVKTGAGSALTRDVERLGEIVRSVVRAAKNSARPQIPVTVKIRSGWDSEHLTYKEAALAAIESGASAITLHARTRAQGYEGKANWDFLSELVRLSKEKTGGIVKIFGSGDAFSPQDAKKMLLETDCDGVMFARGAMGNPFIFERTRTFLLTGEDFDISFDEKIKAGFRELALLVEDLGEKGACLEARKRFCAYARGVNGSATLRRKIVQAESVSDYRALFSEWL